MSTEVSLKVIAAIAKVKRLPVERVQLDSRFEDLGMDSLDGLNVFFELEETFDIAIPDEQAKSLRSVRDVVDAISRVLELRHAPDGNKRAGA
jgi:acyl carrier protein